MDIIFEFLFEIIFESLFGLVSYRKVPLIIRIIVGILIVGVYGGLVGLCFFFGIKNSSIVLIILGIFILLLSVLAGFRIYKKRE